MRKQIELDLVGERGRLRIGTHVADLWRLDEAGRATLTPLTRPRTTRAYLVAALDELIGLVERGGVGSSTGADGRRVIAILLGILQSSAAGGRRVDFPISDAPLPS